MTFLLVDGPTNAERASGLLQIESPFRVESHSDEWTIVPSDQSTLAPVCKLLHQAVVTAQMDDDQTLRLSFSDGSTVTVPRDRQYESWNLTGTGVPQVLVTPP